MAGIAQPLKQLATMHALLDVTEHLMLESCKDDKEREQVRIKLYAPPPNVPVKPGAKPPPGWSAEEEMAGFSALTETRRMHPG